MGFYDSEQNVDAYVRMAEGFDGRELVAVLERHLAPGSSVLEIGMGPGKDLRWLGRRFRPTGSDNSSIFVDRARAADPTADVLALDAVTLETDRRFDAIYSNKVLQHLTPGELTRSLRAQRRILSPNGLVLHGLWRGDRLEVHQGERFQYYTEQTFAARVGALFEIVETGTYAEMADDDSLYVVLRRMASRVSSHRFRAGSGRRSSAPALTARSPPDSPPTGSVSRSSGPRSRPPGGARPPARAAYTPVPPRPPRSRRASSP